MLLDIKNLHISAPDKEIVHGVSLQIKPGEIHAIMGPNGAGKTTLSGVLAGKENYEVTSGEVIYKGKNLLEMAPEIRGKNNIIPELSSEEKEKIDNALRDVD